MNKPLTLRFEDTPEMRAALAEMASDARVTAGSVGAFVCSPFTEIARAIDDALAIAPEPVDPPKFDGGGDQP